MPGFSDGWLGVPSRPGKPRHVGLTHVMDKGLNIRDIEGMFDTAGDFVDIVKFGWGTSYVTNNLEKKIALYRHFETPVVCGGTLFEAVYAKGKLDEFKAWLVEHRFKRKLACHHCGHEAPSPDVCPKCEKPDSFTAIGPGVERLEEETRGHFPDARILVLSSDLIGGVERMQAELESITKGEIDIVIGTQLVAKGHHFPGLALVGVIDADLGLGQGDPRAAERTFQLLHQVVGRAGREATDGKGLLQTYQPEHPVMQALIEGDRQAFYDREIAAREETGLPPFGRLASLIVSASEKAAAEGYARQLAAIAPYNEAIRILGPAEAPLALIRGRHRFRLLAKSARMFDLSGYLRDWFSAAPSPRGGVKVAVDVDPQSFL